MITLHCFLLLDVIPVVHPDFPYLAPPLPGGEGRPKVFPRGAGDVASKSLGDTEPGLRWALLGWVGGWVLFGGKTPLMEGTLCELPKAACSIHKVSTSDKRLIMFMHVVVSKVKQTM